MWNRLYTVYLKYFAVWVFLGGFFAYLFPGVFLFLKNGMSIFFAMTMFGIGAVLEVADFGRIVRQPWMVALGVASQYVIMPLGAFVLSRVFDLPPAIAIGLILTGSAPGAMASNVFSYIARADTAYSVSLTTVSTILCPILTPLLTYTLGRGQLDIPFWPMLFHLMITVVGPVCLGVLFRHCFRKSMQKVEKVFPVISVTFIIFICSVVIASNRESILQSSVLLFGICCLLHVYGLAMGYAVGKTFRLSRKTCRTLSIEIGMQNAGLGTVLALKHFSAQTALPAAMFVFICILGVSILSELWRRAPAEQHGQSSSSAVS